MFLLITVVTGNKPRLKVPFWTNEFEAEVPKVMNLLSLFFKISCYLFHVKKLLYIYLKQIGKYFNKRWFVEGFAQSKVFDYFAVKSEKWSPTQLTHYNLCVGGKWFLVPLCKMKSYNGNISFEVRNYNLKVFKMDLICLLTFSIMTHLRA